MAAKKRTRKGATVLEMSIILGTFLILTFGILEFSIAVFRYHVVSQASRYAARRAIVHGELATALGSWGTTTIEAKANAVGIPIIDDATTGIQDKLFGCDLAETDIKVEWLDGSNGFEKSVRVTVTSPYQPVLFTLFPQASIDLTASSTMQIAH